MKYLILILFSLSNLFVFSEVNIGIHNFSQDKDATHKALDYEREKDLRGEKKDVRLELKGYREKIYQLKREIAYEKEQAREYIVEMKALRNELKEDIKKRNKLKKTVESSGSGVLSFASKVTLGTDLTDRDGDKARLHILNQLIKVKGSKIRELKATARKFYKNMKVKKLEIAELRNEMAILAQSEGLKIKPVTGKKNKSTRRKVSSE